MITQKNQQGFTLVEIMIVVAIIALLAAIAIPNLLRARLSSNDALAQSTLRTISTAAESYGTANNGSYPATSAAMTTANPPYLNVDYCADNSVATALAGYYYTCTLTATSYTVTATPASCNTTGSKVWTITTGGVLTSAGC